MKAAVCPTCATEVGELGIIDAALHAAMCRPTSVVARTVAALQARPDLALQVLDQLRVARPWVEDRDGPEPTWCRWDARAVNPDPLAEPAGFVFREPQDALWYGTAFAVPIPDGFATDAEARAAVDTALSACGWALAGAR